MANLEREGVRDRITHVRKPSQDATGDIPGELEVVYIDGAHRYAPAKADIVRWGDKVAPGGTLLIHDSFSSIGVTLAQLAVLVFGGDFRYVGRSQSMTEYRREPVRGGARVGNAAAPAPGAAVLRAQRALQGAHHAEAAPGHPLAGRHRRVAVLSPAGWPELSVGRGRRGRSRTRTRGGRAARAAGPPRRCRRTSVMRASSAGLASADQTARTPPAASVRAAAAEERLVVEAGVRAVHEEARGRCRRRAGRRRGSAAGTPGRRPRRPRRAAAPARRRPAPRRRAPGRRAPSRRARRPARRRPPAPPAGRRAGCGR